MGIQQQDATESLKRADGDISAAFENELARIQLHKQKLHELVLEYAGYRYSVDALVWIVSADTERGSVT